MSNPINALFNGSVSNRTEATPGPYYRRLPLGAIMDKAATEKAKHEQGWVEHINPPCCRNCKRMYYPECDFLARRSIKCTLGGFVTRVDSCCNEHEPQ